MMSLREQVVELRNAAALVPIEGWGEKAALLDEANEAEWKADQRDAIVQRVLAIVNPRRDEKERERAELMRARDSDDIPLTPKLWRELERGDFDRPVPDPRVLLEVGQASRYPDEQDQLDGWGRDLLAAGLITLAEWNACKPQIPQSPKRREQQLKEEADYQGLRRELNYYLAEVKAKHGWWGWRMALQIYNSMSEAPLSREKLDQWRVMLVSGKWLDAKHHPRGRLGGMIERTIKGEARQTA